MNKEKFLIFSISLRVKAIKRKAKIPIEKKFRKK